MIFACVLLQARQAMAIDVIINNSVPEKQLSKHKLRAIFTMNHRYWPDGENIKVYVLKDSHPTHKSFSRKKLNMFAHQLRRVWDRKTFSGTGYAPTIVKSELEMLEKIATTPFSIGYLLKVSDNESISTIVLP